MSDEKYVVHHCDVCDVTTSGDKSYQQHMNGTRHRQNLLKQEQGNNETSKKSRSSAKQSLNWDRPLPPDLKPNDPADSEEPEPEFLKLQATTSEALIGLDYVTEYQVFNGSRVPRYECHLCDFKLAYKSALAHVVGFKHRARYLKACHNQYYVELLNRDDQVYVCDNFARQIEGEEGRRMVVVRKETIQSWTDGMEGRGSKDNSQNEVPPRRQSTLGNVTFDKVDPWSEHDTKQNPVIDYGHQHETMDRGQKRRESMDYGRQKRKDSMDYGRQKRKQESMDYGIQNPGSMDYGLQMQQNMDFGQQNMNEITDLRSQMKNEYMDFMRQQMTASMEFDGRAFMGHEQQNNHPSTLGAFDVLSGDPWDSGPPGTEESMRRLGFSREKRKNDPKKRPQTQEELAEKILEKKMEERLRKVEEDHLKKLEERLMMKMSNSDHQEYNGLPPKEETPEGLLQKDLRRIKTDLEREEVPASVILSLVMKNAEKLVTNDEEAAIALSTSNALTQAVLSYRLRYVPKEVMEGAKKTTASDEKRAKSLERTESSQKRKLEENGNRIERSTPDRSEPKQRRYSNVAPNQERPSRDRSEPKRTGFPNVSHLEDRVTQKPGSATASAVDISKQLKFSLKTPTEKKRSTEPHPTSRKKRVSRFSASHQDNLPLPGEPPLPVNPPLPEEPPPPEEPYQPPPLPAEPFPSCPQPPMPVYPSEGQSTLLTGFMPPGKSQFMPGPTDINPQVSHSMNSPTPSQNINPLMSLNVGPPRPQGFNPQSQMPQNFNPQTPWGTWRPGGPR